MKLIIPIYMCICIVGLLYRSKKSTGAIHWWKVELSSEMIIGRVKIMIGVSMHMLMFGRNYYSIIVVL